MTYVSYPKTQKSYLNIEFDVSFHVTLGTYINMLHTKKAVEGYTLDPTQKGPCNIIGVDSKVGKIRRRVSEWRHRGEGVLRKYLTESKDRRRN